MQPLGLDVDIDLVMQPQITIGTATINSSRYLPIFLRHLYRLDYPKKKIRLVFVDNCSEDDTITILQRFKYEHEHEYESIIIDRNTRRGNVAASHNLIVKNSITDYVVILDHDVLAMKDTLKRLIRLASTGAITHIPYLSDTERMPLRMPLRKKVSIVEECQSGCTLYKREVFDQMGYFNEEYPLTDDLEFTRRASRAGFRVVVDSRQYLIHLNPDPHRKTPSQDFIDIIREHLEVRRRLREARLYWSRYDRLKLYGYLGLLCWLPASYFLCLLSQMLSKRFLH